MADITVTKNQVEELAAKLDRLGQDLSDDERSLLLAVFALAGEAISERSGQDVEGFMFGSAFPKEAGLKLSGYEAPSRLALSEGFKSSFVGGRAGGFGSAAGVDMVVQT
jgi:hypothetical protein